MPPLPQRFGVHAKRILSLAFLLIGSHSAVAQTPAALAAALGDPTGEYSAGGDDELEISTVSHQAFDEGGDPIPGQYVITNVVSNKALAQGQASWLEWHVEGPCRITFDDYHPPIIEYLGLYYPRDVVVWDNGSPVTLKGSVRDSYSEYYTLSLPAGDHHLRWRFEGPLTAKEGLLLGKFHCETIVDQSPSLAPAIGLSSNQLFVSGDWQISNALLSAVGGSTAVGDSSDERKSGPALRTEFEGPAVLNYRYAWRPWGYAETPIPPVVMLDRMVFTGSANEEPMMPANGYWRWFNGKIVLPPGRTMVGWQIERPVLSSASATVALDTITISPMPSIPLAQAFGIPSTQITQGGAVPWSAHTDPTGATHLAPANGLHTGEETWMEAVVDGPAKLDIGGVQIISPDAALDVFIDGSVVKSFNTTTFTSFSKNIGSGPHVLRWLAKRGPSGEGQRGTVEIGPLRIVRNLPSSLPTTLPGWSSFTLKSNPTQPWILDPATAGTGPNSNGATFVNTGIASSWAELNLDGPKWIVFDWNRTLIPVMHIDGKPLLDANYETQHTTLNPIPSGLYLPAGRHSLKWQGIGPMTFASFTDPTPPALLPGDPATLGLPQQPVFHLNSTSGWTVDNSKFTEGGGSWTAGRGQNFWLGVQGPGTFTFTARLTGTLPASQILINLENDVIRGFSFGPQEWQTSSAQIPVGWHVLQLQNYSNLGASVWVDGFSYTPSQPFHQWAQTKVVPMSQWNATTDSDGDGIPNAVEYALGLDPIATNGAIGTAVADNSGGISISFPKPIAGTGATTTVEVSSDLIHWSDSQTAGLSLTNNGVNLTVVMTPPWKYGRLKVALP